jgi:phage FluMu protein Com
LLPPRADFDLSFTDYNFMIPEGDLMAPQPSAAATGKVRWQEMRCSRCSRLLQKVEENALRPGRRLEIKCSHCKVMNYLVGEESTAS